ncbi:MAG: AMP-binding protein, partial [Gammaproteobacteria bacterium]|nr:AMP-binding protein [Gammaproteobacteria bacterium]
FTSGSTGAPKAVAHTHADFLHCSLNYARHVMGLRANDCVYTPSRIFFAYGLNNMMQSLLAGASHVLAAPLPRDRRVVDIISMYRVTAFLAVPAIYKIALTEGKPRPNLCSLRLCISAGEKLPVKLYWEAKAYFGVTVLDGIGNTEAISTFISNRMSGATHNCTGRLVPGFKVRLINERGELCRVGEVGVLWVKGNTLTKGYINDEPATSVHFVDGWFNTQDMFFMDATRRFYNVGRVGSIIKINASWFSPDLLESALQAHPAVKECAVCMAHDDYGLPRPKAFVVVDSSHEAPDDLEQLWQELRTLSKDRLGRNHYPHHFSVVAELPRTSSGKLIRSALVATSLQ